jgi:hypothetical protein
VSNITRCPNCEQNHRLANRLAPRPGQYDQLSGVFSAERHVSGRNLI